MPIGHSVTFVGLIGQYIVKLYIVLETELVSHRINSSNDTIHISLL